MKSTAMAARQSSSPSAAPSPLLKRTHATEQLGDSRTSLKSPRQPAHSRHGTAVVETIPPIVRDVLGSSGQALDADLRETMEARFQHDFSRVRVHTGGQAGASARAVQAKAYTVGRDVVFSPGRFSSGAEGQRLLAHELAHVVQQSRGGVKAGPSANVSLEAEAETAAQGFATGAHYVPIQGRAAASLLRAPDPDLEEEEKKKQPSQATLTAVTQRPKEAKPLDLPVREINDPKKGVGVRGEVTVPFDRYAGWDWNHIAGGGESASSRINVARRSSHDERTGREASAGFDFIVENVKTGRLVIGEQKATQGNEFTKATAVTTNLEKNLGHSIKTLQQHLDSGAVKEPAEATRLQKTIERLQATKTALEAGRAGKPVELPEGVVFELTNVGGKGEKIGKEHVDLLAEKYGKNPAFLEHILSRTFVRDPKLAKAVPREASGQRGSDADPDAVPATDILTKDAEGVLERLRAGKTEKQWKADRAKERAKQERDERDRQVAARKAEREQRAADEAKARDRAKQLGEEARQQRLKQLHEERAQGNEPEPRTKRQREQANRKLETEAKRAGKQAEKSSVNDFLGQRREQDAEATARRREEAGLAKQARQQQRDAERQARAQRDAQKDLEKQQKAAARREAEEAGSLKTPESVLKLNEEARRSHAAEQREVKMSKAAHAANQAAAGIRAYDAYQDALDKGQGQVGAALAAGKTYLDNTNPVFGTVSTVEQRLQKDERGQQYYGDDAVDAWLGTLGETGAGFVVPGAGWDQLINAGSNVAGAVDDHLQKGKDPSSSSATKANARTFTDLAADVTPSRMFAQTVGAGARSYYDLARAARGDTKGVDKFAEDAVRGKLGSVLQPWAMAADFVGNLGSDSASVALEKTVKKTEGTTLKKVGDASGDALYELGQSKKAKSGKYGSSVQGISMTLGITSDLIAGKSFDKALNDAAEAGKGSLADKVGSALGDATFTAVEKGKEILNEDLPAAKKKAEQAIDQTKKRVSDWWRSL